MKWKPKKETTRKKLRMILAILLVISLIAGGLAAFIPSKPQEQSTLTAVAERGEMEVVTEGSGSVEAKKSISVPLVYDSLLEQLEKQNGDVVKKGDVIAQMKSSGLDQYISQLVEQLDTLDLQLSRTSNTSTQTITSTVAGRVKRIHLQKGDDVNSVMKQHQALMEIAADGKLKIEFTAEQPMVVGEDVTVKFGTYTVDGTVVAHQQDKTVVTMLDSYSYNVDEKATIYNKKKQTVGKGVISSNQPFWVTGTQGKVNNIYVEKNEKVYKGKTLLSLMDMQYTGRYLDLLTQRNQTAKNLYEAREYRKNLQIIAPIDGVVTDIDMTMTAPLLMGKEFCKIIDQHESLLKVDIDEMDIQRVQQGQLVTILLDAYEEQLFTGTVDTIAGLGKGSDGVATFSVTILLKANDNIKNGMSATAKIVLDRRDDVLLIPVDAIQTIDGKKYVTRVTKQNKQEEQLVEVSIGLVNAAFAEILTGLNEGDEVKLTRIVNENNFNNRKPPFPSKTPSASSEKAG